MKYTIILVKRDSDEFKRDFRLVKHRLYYSQSLSLKGRRTAVRDSEFRPGVAAKKKREREFTHASFPRANFNSPTRTWLFNTDNTFLGLFAIPLSLVASRSLKAKFIQEKTCGYF